MLGDLRSTLLEAAEVFVGTRKERRGTAAIEVFSGGKHFLKNSASVQAALEAAGRPVHSAVICV